MNKALYPLTWLLLLFSLLPAMVMSAEPREVIWDDLLPDDWRPDPELVRQYQEGEIGDDDPRIIAFRKKLEDPNPPVNEKLSDQSIRISGYVVPLEVDSKKTFAFLLVPFIGACIHVPPPPPNQQIYVTLTDLKGKDLQLFDWVEIQGELKTESRESEYSSVGYQMAAKKVEIVPE